MRPPTRPEAITAGSFFYNPIIHPTVTLNFPTFKKMGACYGKDFLKLLPASESISVNSCAEDYIMFGQIGLFGLCANIAAPLIKYRVHSGSAERCQARQTRSGYAVRWRCSSATPSVR